MLPASDVYSFGVIAEECFLRQDPRHGAMVTHRLESLIEEDSESRADSSVDFGRRTSLAVEIPSHVAAIVSRCRHKDIASRPEFRDVQHLLKQLGETSVGKAFLRRGMEGRRQDRILQQVEREAYVAAVRIY